MDERDDTLGKTGAEVIQLSVVKGGRSETPDLHDSCAGAIEQLDGIKEQIIEDRMSTLVLVALTVDGEYTRMILSKSRFELLGLATDLAALITEEVTCPSDPD